MNSRCFAQPDDLQKMLDLLTVVRLPERLADFPSAVDLHEAMALSKVQENTRLWFGAAGRLAGFAYVDPYCNLRFEFEPQHLLPEMEREIVAWGETCIRWMMQAEGEEALTLDASCREDDTARIALLERHGFERLPLRSLHLARSLTEPIPEPQVPAGFSIRHVTGEQEAAALAALHRAAFGTTHMTVEERLAMMRVPDYEAALDLLAVAENGRFAATCLCAVYQSENVRTGRQEGYTDPIATHPEFQRKGLARALLLTGLQKLKERGMETAVLGTSSENEAMQQLALAVGFRVESTTLWFARPVTAN